MTPTQYIASLPEPRRSEVRKLHAIVRKAAPKLKPEVDNYLGYGRWHYKYPSGREGDTFVVAIASFKQAISLYVMATRGTRWLPEVYAKRLGNVSCGKAACASASSWTSTWTSCRSWCAKPPRHTAKRSAATPAPRTRLLTVLPG